MLQPLSQSLRYLVSLDTALWYRATSIVTLSIPAISPRGRYTLAIVEAMESFAHLLLHRHFTVVTDYKSLTKLMKKKNLNGRQPRWLTHISKDDYEIEYLPGAKNFLADYLSRIQEVDSGPEDITLKDPIMDEKEPTPSARCLTIHTHYTSSREYSTESENTMTQTDHSATLTSREYIYRTPQTTSRMRSAAMRSPDLKSARPHNKVALALRVTIP